MSKPTTDQRGSYRPGLYTPEEIEAWRSDVSRLTREREEAQDLVLATRILTKRFNQATTLIRDVLACFEDKGDYFALYGPVRQRVEEMETFLARIDGAEGGHGSYCSCRECRDASDKARNGKAGA